MDNQNTTTTTTAAGNPAPGVPLDKPIIRGDQTITAINLRRPLAGELRGVDIAGLLRQMDYGALETLLPRISSPTLTRADVAQLDPADLAALAAEVMLFFVPKAATAELSLNS